MPVNTAEATLPIGANAVTDRMRVTERYRHVTLSANGSFAVEAGGVGNLLVSNSDASAKTINLYDDVSGGSTTTSPVGPPIVIAAGAMIAVPLYTEFALGLRAAAASWTGLTAVAELD